MKSVVVIALVFALTLSSFAMLNLMPEAHGPNPLVVVEVWTPDGINVMVTPSTVSVVLGFTQIQFAFAACLRNSALGWLTCRADDIGIANPGTLGLDTLQVPISSTGGGWSGIYGPWYNQPSGTYKYNIRNPSNFVVLDPFIQIISPTYISGPMMNNKVMMIYGSPAVEQTALENHGIDLIDWPLSSQVYNKWTSGAPYGISVEETRDLGVFSFDMNTNYTMDGLPGAIYTYPGIPSPTGDVKFRRAISTLVDKASIATVDFGGIMEINHVPLTTPMHGAYIDPVTVAEWTSGPLSYDPVTGAAALDNAGYTQGTTPNPYYDGSPGSAMYLRAYPVWHPKAAQNLDPLIFYIRADLSELRAAGLRFADTLRKAGIPVQTLDTDKATCFNQVMGCFGYHLYTSYRKLEPDVDHLHDWYSADFAKPFDYNYMINNAMYVSGVGPTPQSLWLESQLDTVKYAPTKSALTTFAQSVQPLLFGSQGTIPSIILGRYNHMYTAYLTGWKGVVNEEGRGVKNWYTEAMAYNPTTNTSTLRVGLHNDVHSLNPVTTPSEENIDYTGWNVLWEVYDPLIRRDPYTLPYIQAFEMPMGLADDWRSSSVWDSFQGKVVTRLLFHVRPYAVWHDFSPVTDADVKFSIDYHKAQMGTFYSQVMNVNRVTLPGSNWVAVYMDGEYCLALHWVGSIPIIKQSIWQNVANAYTYNPQTDDVNGNGIIDLVEDGSGPWVFNSYIPGTAVILNAFTNWYLTTGFDDPSTAVFDPGDVERGVMEAFHRLGDINYDAVVDKVDRTHIVIESKSKSYQSAPRWKDDQYPGLMYSPAAVPPDPYGTGWAGPFDWIGVISSGTNYYDGSHPSPPWFSPFWGNHPWRATDINYDNKVNSLDISICAKNLNRRAGSGW